MMTEKERSNNYISIGRTADDDIVNDTIRNESFPDRGNKDEGESILMEPERKISRRRSSAMEEDEFYPKNFQDELNEIMEAFYAAVGEEGLQEYQRLVESIYQRSIAEGAVQAVTKAPDFDLEDQDGDRVKLSDLYKKGPVVLVFYRGKWCPHCNATILALSREMERFQAKGATLVAISPMLPDGTHYLATKRSLEFSVCSDVGNVVARKYRLTFQIPPECQVSMMKWGEDAPAHNGDDSWEIPLPATYIIDRNGDVVWSFVDNDPGIRASPEDILAEIPSSEEFSSSSGSRVDQVLAEEGGKQRLPNRRHLSSTFKTKVIKRLFGKKKQEPMDFISNYLLPKE